MDYDCCCASGLEDAEVEKEDGYFGEEDDGVVEDLADVAPLRVKERGELMCKDENEDIKMWVMTGENGSGDRYSHMRSR